MNSNNGKSSQIFTIASGNVMAGTVIETLHLKSAGIDIPAIMIGEEGRGRERGVVPVGNPPMMPCPERNKGNSCSTLFLGKANTMWILFPKTRSAACAKK